jgi:hypothetical protein
MIVRKKVQDVVMTSQSPGLPLASADHCVDTHNHATTLAAILADPQSVTHADLQSAIRAGHFTVTHADHSTVTLAGL